MIVHHCRGERHWQSYEIELLQQLATQVAIALQQSELYSRVQAELIERQRIEQELRVSEERYRERVRLRRKLKQTGLTQLSHAIANQHEATDMPGSAR